MEGKEHRDEVAGGQDIHNAVSGQCKEKGNPGAPGWVRWQCIGPGIC